MKKALVLLPGSVRFDGRVKKIIKSIQQFCTVDLFYINGMDSDKQIFDSENVQLFSIDKKEDFISKFLRNSFFFWEYRYMVKAVKQRSNQYNFIYANDLPALFPAVRIKKMNKSAILIYDSHEIYLELFNQFLLPTKNPLKNILFDFLIRVMKISGKIAERKLLTYTDYRITVSEALANHFKNKYHYDFSVMMNCPELKDQSLVPVQLRKMMNWNVNDRIFIYQGFLNHGRGLSLLVAAMRFVHRNIKLLLIGEGHLKKELVDYVKQYHLESKVAFIDFLDYEELWTYIKASDFGISFLENINLNTTFGMPNKFFEYIHAELPLLCSDNLGFRSVLAEYKIGMITELNVEDIRKSMEYLAFKADTEEMIGNCRKAKYAFEWKSQVKVLENILIKYN